MIFKDAIKDDDELQPPTPREVEFFNETLTPKSRPIPRKKSSQSRRSKNIYRHSSQNLSKQSRDRRPRQTDAATQTTRNASTQTSPPPVDAVIAPRALKQPQQYSQMNKNSHFHRSKNTGLEDISLAELQQILMMIRRRNTQDQQRVSAPNVKMFVSAMPGSGLSPSGENTGESVGVGTSGRSAPLSPSRVNFPKKDHGGKLEVVPRLRFEKLRSPRAQFGAGARPLSSERLSSDRAHHAALSSDRAQYAHAHVIPSPRSAFSDVGSEGAYSHRSCT